jgi:organic radical activating enzyme
MDLEKIKQYEIEITSKCNARCPGCSRTHNGDTHPDLKMLEISLSQFKHIFPPNTIKDRAFGFSGVYGDPGMAKDIILICKYILENNPSKVWLDTNGGMQTEKFWHDLSQLSFKYNHKLVVGFNIDGYKDTNHMYRVNVIWDKLIKNITAYSKGQGRATWSYIEFDHNTSDIDNARQLAKELGFNFRVRRSSRNQIKAPWKTNKTTITTNKKEIQHSQAQVKFNVTKKIESETVKNTKFKDISCRLIHEQRAYISHDMKLWPCCWIGDMYHDSIRPSVQKQGRDKLFEIEEQYGKNWNDLRHNSIDNILGHEYYDSVLEDSWDTDHNLYIKRCVIECGGHGSRAKVEYQK